MVKKNLLIGLGILILVTLLVIVCSSQTSGKQDLPSQFKVNGFDLGNTPSEIALLKIKERMGELENRKVTISQSALSGKLVMQNIQSKKQVPILTLKELGLQLDAKKAKKAIRIYTHGPWIKKISHQLFFGRKTEVIATWKEDVLKQKIHQTWGKVGEKRALDAKRIILRTDKIKYEKEQPGQRIDFVQLTQQIRNLASTPTLLAKRSETAIHKLHPTFQLVAPLVTEEQLRLEGIQRRMGQFSTSFATSGSGRVHNVKVMARTLNNTILPPDGVFSYQDIVSLARRKEGFKEAPVIFKGKLVPGIGGGICQVSSTLYNAALLSGLEIMERQNHSLPVSYLKRGLDATFSDGYINFKFRNSTGKHLLIRAKSENKELNIKMFGSMDEDISYATKTSQIQVLLPKTIYHPEPNLSLGQEQIVHKGANGYVVDSFLLIKKKGKVWQTKKLYRDTYSPQNWEIAVHPEDPRISGLDAPLEDMKPFQKTQPERIVEPI